MESSLTTLTDEINKFMGYDDNNRPVISFEKVVLMPLPLMMVSMTMDLS